MAKKSDDPMADAYAAVRDATFCNDSIELADKIAILSVVLYECNQAFQDNLVASLKKL